MRQLLHFIIFFSLSFEVVADQPVMNMAPRWEDGYGFQVRYESYGSDKLLKGDSSISNPIGLKRYVERTWFEGVYTFDKSKRVTFKLPYVNQRRTINNQNEPLRQKANGLGDIIIGVPLKYYTNKGGFTSNYSFTPSLRMPTGDTSGDFPISDGSWDLGLSLSYSEESSRFHQLYDLYYWVNTDGTGGRNEGDELGFDVHWGYRPYHDNSTNTGLYLMLNPSLIHEEQGDALTTGASGGTRAQVGPVIVFYQDNIMFRAEYIFPVYEDVDGTSLSRGNELNIGIGITF